MPTRIQRRRIGGWRIPVCSCGCEDENRARLPLAWRDKRAPVALYELTAFRCPDCLHDQVQEMLDGTLWDLDDSDYDDAGSFNPTEERRT